MRGCAAERERLREGLAQQHQQQQQQQLLQQQVVELKVRLHAS